MLGLTAMGDAHFRPAQKSLSLVRGRPDTEENMAATRRSCLDTGLAEPAFGKGSESCFGFTVTSKATFVHARVQERQASISNVVWITNKSSSGSSSGVLHSEEEKTHIGWGHEGENRRAANPLSGNILSTPSLSFAAAAAATTGGCDGSGGENIAPEARREIRYQSQDTGLL